MANNLTHFDPFQDIARFDPLRNMEDLFRDFRMMPSWPKADMHSAIRMDISESDKDYHIRAEIPGVKKEDIKVAVDGGRISISAESREEGDVKSGNKVRTERYVGQQYRSVTLPQEVDESKAEAKYKDGILDLTLPKKPGSGGKQIAIH